MTTPVVSSQTHVRALDGVRGLAILLVMIHHMTLFKPHAAVDGFVYETLFSGWIGVELFFVLSGALITGVLLDDRGRPDYFRSFYIRRVLRIFPLYYGLLIFSFYILPHFAHPKMANFGRVAGDEGWYWLFLSNVSIGQAEGFRHGIMDVTWSLAIEEQFYLVWPFVVSLVRPKRLVQVCWAIIVFGLVLRVFMLAGHVNAVAIYVWTPGRLDGLAVGALIALALRNHCLKTDLSKLATRGVAFLGPCVVAFGVWRGGFIYNDVFVQSVGYTLLAFFFGALVLMAYTQNGLRTFSDRILSWRGLTLLGLLSYALYLFHLPIRAIVRDLLIDPDTFASFPGGVAVGQIIYYIVCFALSIGAAALSFYLFEKQFLRLKALLTYKDKTAKTSESVL